MAPPGVLSFYDSLDGHNTSSTSLLLSPFPSFSDCISQFSVFSDHDYFLKNIDNMKKAAASTSDIRFTMGDRCFDSDIPSRGDKCEVMTPSDDLTGLSPSGPLSNGSTEVSDNVFNDVTLVSRLDTPISSDTDFLEGLDELDFDFDDEDSLEPSRGISLESFIDEALGETMDVSINNNSNNNNNNNSNDYSNQHSCNSQYNTQEEEEVEEDVYKKEFFLKHLRLQKAPASTSTTPKPTSARKNRKRKHEESESNRSESLPCPPLSPESTSPRFLTVDVSANIPSRLHDKNNNSSNAPLHLTVPTTVPISVPSKLCSCASSDWKRTILYSTAKSSDVISVQTSPSTASVSGRHSRGGVAAFTGFPLSSPSPRCYSDTFGAQGDKQMNNTHGDLSPSLLLSSKAKECFEFDLLDKNELDEDTKDLLQWLDNQDTQTTIAGITSSVRPNSPLLVPSRSPSENNDFNNNNAFSPSSSSSNDSFTADDLDAILSPTATQQSHNDLDRFQDLEAYVSDTSPPTPVTNDLDPSPKLRLSILADISREFLNAGEHAAAKKDLFSLKTYHSHSPTITNTPYQKLSLSKQSSHSDYWSDDSPFSTTSSSLSSSPSSSPPHSPSDFSHDLVPSHHNNNMTQSKNQDLLDLFSDENAAWCL